MVLIGYLIPRTGIKRSYPIQGFLQLYNIHLGTVRKDILDLLGFGVKKGLNQEGVRASLYEGFKQSQ